MCEAVVVPVRPANPMTETVIMCVTSSQVTVAVPVPGEALDGFSLMPLSVVVNVKMAALAWLTESSSPAAIAAAKIDVLLQRIALPLLFRLRLLENKGVVADDRHLRAVRRQPGDIHFRPADHEIGVDERVADPLGPPLVRILWLFAFEREVEPRAVGDVAGGVLVEEDVVEDETRLADARAAVHERDLAQERRALVQLELGADGVGARRRFDIRDAAVLEGQLEVLDDDAVERQRPRRADGALRAPAVRRREDLLRRHVREMPAAPGRRDRPGTETGKRQEPNREIGSGTVEPERVEAAVVQPRCAIVQVLAVRL